MDTIVLSLFAIALTLVQLSCSKTNAQISKSTSSPSAVNKFAYVKMEGVLTGNIYIITSTLWISNYDGTGKTMVPIPIVGVTADQYTSCSLSPDGQTVSFTTSDQSGNSLYSCNVNGTNLVQIEAPGTVAGVDVHYVAGTAQ